MKIRAFINWTITTIHNKGRGGTADGELEGIILPVYRDIEDLIQSTISTKSQSEMSHNHS
jgi:hypothetical protein